MRVTEAPLEGVLVIEPERYSDSRGWFFESYQVDRYAQHGIPTEFAQDNFSWSDAGVLRGLHLQHPGAQDKLVSCVQGSVLDVAVDLRPDSPTFRRHWTCELASRSGTQIWIPAGIAHGFLALGDGALFHYKCTRPYDPAAQLSIRWDDPELAISWGVEHPRLSPKDASAPSLASILPRLRQ